MNSKLTTSQVAAEFGVSPRTVRAWADSGRLPCSRTLGGERRFDRAAVEKALREASR